MTNKSVCDRCESSLALATNAILYSQTPPLRQRSAAASTDFDERTP
jgi:hypothetical protein